VPRLTLRSNTYAEPPNSDLLRRYGHVDEPNPNNVVEIDAKLIAEVVCAAVKGTAESKDDKIEWLLESGLDEYVFAARRR
jgi:SET domain-containing protein 6